MSEQFDALDETLTAFIHKQPVFFVGTAGADGRVNISPKGQDSLIVTGPNEILWQNLTGSGNETAAHLLERNRMTIMWCAFEGPPMILRVYGQAKVIHPRDAQWSECAKRLPTSTGSRQFYQMTLDLVQTSCGYAVPFMDYREDRTVLTKWADKRGPQGVADYWAEKNTHSIDGKPTGIL